MLTATSSVTQHRLQNLLLILLSVFTLPIDTIVLLASLVRRLISSHGITTQPSATSEATARARSQKRVLITGVGMTKGLSIARLFHQAGHIVIGADFSPLACGRVSNCIQRFYTLTRPNQADKGADYVDGLISIITQQRIDLWISCSGVASAVEDGLAKEAVERATPCKCIQFDVPTTQTLHEKDTFIRRVEETGLNVPKTISVTSYDDAEQSLRSSDPDMRYIMKTVGMNDTERGNMTVLSSAKLEESLSYLRTLRISKDSPWIMQQFISGGEYCTHAVAVNGKVKAFVSCPSAELLMHYEALPSQSALNRAMLDFTERFAAKYGKGFTGHLSFDFMVEEADVEARDWQDIKLYPIECNPRAHTAVALFRNTPETVDAYLSVLEDDPTVDSANQSIAPASNGKSIPNGAPISTPRTPASATPPGPTFPIYPRDPPKTYWLPHDLVSFVVIPLYRYSLQPLLSSLRLSLSQHQHPRPNSSPAHSSPTATHLTTIQSDLSTFLDHILHWEDGTYDPSDPLPYWWLSHVYWPAQFAWCLAASFGVVGTDRTRWRWSRINVSTCKMFEC